MNDAAGGHDEECVSFFFGYRPQTVRNPSHELIHQPFLGSGVRIMQDAGNSLAFLKSWSGAATKAKRQGRLMW